MVGEERFTMSSPNPRVSPPVGPPPMPRVPERSVLEAMSPAERERTYAAILDSLEPLREAMSEGTRHSRPKIGAMVGLSDFFQRAGRRVFLASELAVLYPGEEVIVPDILAVLDTDPDREMESWNVLAEGRGVDLVIEFHNLGRKHKELQENLRDYARLGIREYFFLDVRKKHLRGFRLPPGAHAHVPILGQGGRLVSEVLGLELAVVDGRLRFFHDMAQVLESRELVGLLERMVGERDVRLEEAEGRAAAEAERAERAEAELRALREQLERLRGERD